MTRKNIVFLTRLLGNSLLLPMGLTSIPILLFGALGALNYWANGCLSFDTCYLGPLIDVFTAPKMWRMLLLMWGVGVAVVCYLTYREFKPLIQQWLANFK
jgi:hypothetical protein